MRAILIFSVFVMGLLTEASFVFSEDLLEQRETIKLSVVTVNPSSEKMQTTPVKVYLPKEVTPKDIIESGVLQISYDSAKSLYYAFKEDVELAPLETRTFEIEIYDVWMIPLASRLTLREQSERLLEGLRNTDIYPEAKTIVSSVFARLDEISRTQSDDAVTRDQHIGIYRSNVEIMKNIQNDLDRLERMRQLSIDTNPDLMNEARAKMDTPSKTVTWMIIFTLITFVILLGLVFFITYHRQSRMQDFSEKTRKAFSKESPK